MRDLFRRASFLFWQYPILWLPVVIADLLVFCLNQLQTKLTHAVIMSMAVNHSVLGSTPDPVNSTSRNLQIVLLTKPIVWGTHLLNLCLYAAAMITVATLIPLLHQKLKLSLNAIIFPIKQSFPRLLLFSFKILVAIGIGAILLFLSIALFSQVHGARLITTPNFGYIFVALLLLAIAYLMAPAALNLLRPQGSERVTPDVDRQIRISAVLTVFASTALYFLALQIEPSFGFRSTNTNGILVYEVMVSLVSASPYIVFFITLSLLAKSDEPSLRFLGESD